jgi:glycosyltransferase involved in cell wall biosynthesis
MVGPWPPATGGVATFMMNVARSSLREHYEIIPFTTARPAKLRGGDNYGYRAMLRGGVKRVLHGIVITAWHLAKYPWVIVLRRPALIQIQASDFISFWEASIYVLTAKLLGRPVILRIGGSFNRFWESSGRLGRVGITWTLNQPAVLIVQSEYWKNYVAGMRRSLPIVVLPNFVPNALVEKRIDPPSGTPRFLLYAGETPELKGAFVLLNAVRALAASGVAAHVTMIGVTQRFRDHVESSGLTSNITLREYLSHADVLEQLRRTDVFLQISYNEGFPNTLLEAMALGCASIVTPVGAVPEAVGADGHCAFVIPAGDAAALSDRMARLIAEPQLITRMAAAAHERLVEHFTENTVAQVLDKQYSKMLGLSTEAHGSPRHEEAS